MPGERTGGPGERLGGHCLGCQGKNLGFGVQKVGDVLG